MSKTIRYLTGICKECGSEVKASVGDMTLEEARTALGERQSWECPGGGLQHYVLGSMLNGVNWDFTIKEQADERVSDEEYLAKRRADGAELFSANGDESLGLAALPRDCEHLGYGDFGNSEFHFSRRTTPMGTRYYERGQRVTKTSGYV